MPINWKRAWAIVIAGLLFPTCRVTAADAPVTLQEDASSYTLSNGIIYDCVPLELDDTQPFTPTGSQP